MGFPSSQPRTGDASGGSSSGRVASPRLLRDPTAFESLASHLPRWPPTASSAPASSRASPSHTRSSSITVNGHGVSSLMEEDGEGGLSALDSGAEERDAEQGGKGKERASWSSWDKLDSDNGDDAPRRVLLQAYEPSGFSIWDCSTLDSWYELLRLESLERSLRPDLASRFPRGLGAIVGATILPTPSDLMEDPWTESRPLIAIATHLRDSNEAQLVLYSLRSHQIVHTLAAPLPSTPHHLQSNSRQLVLSTSSPLALHVLSATTFEPLPFSPITDLSPSPFDGAPVWDLGRGGRTLAYATTRAVIPSHGAARFDREPARPGAGILALRGMFDSDSRTGAEDGYDMQGGMSGGGMGEGRSAGQVGGEVARRVGEGMLKGAKAIGDIGLSYWQTRNTPSSPQLEGVDAPTGRNFSKSAPLPSVAGWERRGSVSSGGALSPKVSMVRLSTQGADSSPAAGTVLVVDLLSSSATSPPSSSSTKSRPRKTSRSSTPTLKTLAHFRPYSHPIALLSLSPSSLSILTSSTYGHSFEIFEFKPAARVTATTKGDASSGKVWHRYRLHRGLTAARAVGAEWAEDGRFVGVGTGKGTTHLFAIEPFGGKPQLDNHFGAKITNATDLAPLSVALSTIARIRPSSVRHDEQQPTPFITPPSITFVSKADSLNSSFRPIPSSRLTSPIIAPSRPNYRGSPSSMPIPLASSTSAGAGTTFQDLLVFYPHSSLTILERLQASPAPASTVEAATRGDVGRIATTAVSGLSQMMKSRGGVVGTGAGEEKREWSVGCSAKAEWEVGRDGKGEVREMVEIGEGRGTRAVGRYSAQAEIETFSRSPQVLPRSIYLSQQFDFFALPTTRSLPHTSLIHLLPTLRQLAVRSSVQLRPGPHSPLPLPLSPSSSSLSLPLSPLEPHSLDQPIKSAMQTILDSYPDPSSSPSQSAAGFPNGVPGKTGSTRWRDAIPLHAAHVNAGLAIGIGSVRSGLGELGRVGRQVAQAGAGVAAARMRAGGAGAVGAEDVSCSSVSFEDDAVFAEYREEGTDSTAATSERGSEGCDMEEEAEAWGLDGLHEEAIDSPAMAPIGAEHEGLPFEDDFDDFELALDRPSSSATTKPLIPDLLLSHTARPSPHSSTLTPAPIIDFDSAHSSSSLEAASSPKKESHPHLLDELSLAASPLISGSPSSFSSSSGLPSTGGIKKKSKKKKAGAGSIAC